MRVCSLLSRAIQNIIFNMVMFEKHWFQRYSVLNTSTYSSVVVNVLNVVCLLSASLLCGYLCVVPKAAVFYIGRKH